MTTTTTSIGGGGEDMVLATAQQVMESLNTPKEEVREEFDATDCINKTEQDKLSSQSRFGAAEKAIFRWEESCTESSLHSLPCWEDSPDEAVQYLAAVDDILHLVENLAITSDNDMIDRAESAIQLAMWRLEEEFRHILIRNTVPLDADRLYGSISEVSLSFAANDGEIDEDFESYGEIDNEIRCFHERGVTLGDDLCVDLMRADSVVELKEIADRMIRSGYEKECVQVYSNVRHDAWDEYLVIIGVEKLSIEEVQRLDWKSLDEQMKKWIQTFKIVIRVLLTGEKRLCEQIFSGSGSAKEVCFNETAKRCVMQLLDFGAAVAFGIRSSEKLFRILNMYDALADVLPDLQAMVTDEFLCNEAKEVLTELGEAAIGSFFDFENAVKNESSQKPMPGGEIHPITRYVMNYIKLLLEYSNTLNTILESDDGERDLYENVDGNKLQQESTSPFARRLSSLISLLESNIEETSRLYEDGAMSYIFLMNNILYVIQKVKDSELEKLLGDHWVREHCRQIRQYATSYLRASWIKALSCLKDEGGSTRNASEVALKERIKNFNANFEKIYRIQTAWRVFDPQLREDLQIFISDKVIPAYRVFIGRFGSQLENARHSGKYIKYTPEDLECYLLDLFEGSPGVLHHLRRKSTCNCSGAHQG